MSPEPEILLENLLDWFKSQDSVLVAFSGGADSSLLAKIASMVLGKKSLAVTADSSSLSRSELEESKKLSIELGITHMVIKTEELKDSRYSANNLNRCYFCKEELFAKLGPIATQYGIKIIVDGTNVSDLESHRPGTTAAVEHGIRSPFVELNIKKEDVRALSKILGLSTFDKASTPCLSSRIAHGVTVTEERLARVERAEAFIKSVVDTIILRVRDHGEIARIEVGREDRCLFFDEEILDKVDSELKKLGYLYVSFDFGGYRSGNMNQSDQLLVIKA